MSDEWELEAGWEVESREAALARAPEYGQQFFDALFREFPALAERTTFLTSENSPDHVFAFFDADLKFGVQIDTDLDYLIVMGPRGDGEYFNWDDADQNALHLALDYAREIVAALDS
jgi:hypothetical protein